MTTELRQHAEDHARILVSMCVHQLDPETAALSIHELPKPALEYLVIALVDLVAWVNLERAADSGRTQVEVWQQTVADLASFRETHP